MKDTTRASEQAQEIGLVGVAGGRMTPHSRPLPPVPAMAPVGPRHVSGTGKPGSPFVLEDETVQPAPEWAQRRQLDREAEARRRARRDHMLAIVSAARHPGDREDPDR
jgi:hypothetical protein